MTEHNLSNNHRRLLLTASNDQTLHHACLKNCARRWEVLTIITYFAHYKLSRKNILICIYLLVPIKYLPT